ncbi:MAG: FN3 associated domain-containing protein [Bacteroidia bacterium]|nr:FN3 associated domain-containing protein [Bacteroidia bacterium]
MKSFESIIANVVFAIQILLVFLLIFETKVALPLWLQPLGRMHPLILHLPIGCLVLLAAFQLFRKNLQGEGFEKIQRFSLYLTVLFTSLTALMGFFLSREEGYDSDLMNLHKWTGVIVSFLVYGLLILYQNPDRSLKLFQLLLAVSVAVLVAAGHFGAGVTHGANFLWEPVMDKKAEITQETTIFGAAVMPILEEKCTSCHNPSKKKGELDMTSAENLLAGGKNGPVWKAGDLKESHIIQRVHLPLEDEDHMPPEGKPQLTVDEINLIEQWIHRGADTELKITDLAPDDSLRGLMALTGKKADENHAPLYEFEPADEKTIRRLNDPFRNVFQPTFNSPALHAQFFVRESFTSKRLEELLAVKTQLISLNLTNMPVKDDDLKTIGQFTNLEKLILNGTDVTGATFSDLAGCTKLRSLAFSNTSVNKEILFSSLHKLTGLKDVFLWSTAVSENDLPELTEKFPDIGFEYGYIPDDSTQLALTPPVLVNESNVLKEGEWVALKHNFPGVTIRYTLDGTDPDSLKSKEYTEPFQVAQFTEVRALAYNPSWLASDIVSFTFFKEGFYPKEVKLMTRPNDEYIGSGGRTLMDGEKGNANTFRSPLWLGYRERPLMALFDFGDTPPEISHTTLSYARNIGSYIMPPVYIEVWGGDDENSMKKLHRLEPKPVTGYEVVTEKGLDLAFEPSKFRFYKVIAQPIQRMPAWHGGAGSKGWVFVDEIFWY